MDSKTILIVFVVSLPVLGLSGLVQAADDANSTAGESILQIYLPRDVTIRDDVITLGKIGVIRGEESLVGKAEGIALGRISVQGQEVTIDRLTVLSRLACNGIPASQLTLTGAEKVTVKRQERIITGSEFVELAGSFLKKELPADLVWQAKPIRMPANLVVPVAGKDIKLSPRLARSEAENQVKVVIDVFAGEGQIGTREVIFPLEYNCSRVVAMVDIDAGTVLDTKNVKVEKVRSNHPDPVDWKSPYGLVVKRRLPANTIITPDMAGPVKPAVIVKRNQTVIIRVDIPGLLITVMGRMLQDGRTGECVKVQNMDSRRIILARVNEDGTVEPVS